ncbi:MAG: hypothetical protein H6Q00_2237 [Holophagaceae bacterium]|nr:hypothetical protein [Holophagaceae bacterium]
MEASDIAKALCQGVYENNRRLARALAEWGGPLEEGQVRGMLHHWAFGYPQPGGFDAPEPLVDRRPQWRDIPSSRACYRERRDTQRGRIVSGDTLLYLIPGVAENPPLALSAFAHVDLTVLSELSSLGTRIRDQALDGAGKAPVILMAGGNAVGKSAVAYQLIRYGFEGAVIDSPWVAEQDVRKVLNRGHEAWVVYVDRPFEDAFQSMVLRAADEGRLVDPSEMARTHNEVPQRLLQGLAIFRNQPRVSCWHLQNTASDLKQIQAVGGPLHREGKDALTSIRLRSESRSRADFELAAGQVWARFRQAVRDRHQNPYPTDLADEIDRKMA